MDRVSDGLEGQTEARRQRKEDPEEDQAWKSDPGEKEIARRSTAGREGGAIAGSSRGRHGVRADEGLALPASLVHLDLCGEGLDVGADSWLGGPCVAGDDATVHAFQPDGQQAEDGVVGDPILRLGVHESMANPFKLHRLGSRTMIERSAIGSPQPPPRGDSCKFATGGSAIAYRVYTNAAALARHLVA